MTKKCKRCPQIATFGVVLDLNKFVYLCGNCLYAAIKNEEVVNKWPILDEKEKRTSR